MTLIVSLSYLLLLGFKGPFISISINSVSHYDSKHTLTLHSVIFKDKGRCNYGCNKKILEISKLYLVVHFLLHYSPELSLNHWCCTPTIFTQDIFIFKDSFEFFKETLAVDAILDAITCEDLLLPSLKTAQWLIFRAQNSLLQPGTIQIAGISSGIAVIAHLGYTRLGKVALK